MLMRSLPDDANSAVIAQLSPVARGEPAAVDARSREHLVKILFDHREILISVTDRPVQPAPGRQESAAHFHVVNAALAEHLRELYDDAGSHEVLVVDPRVVREPAVERLVQAFVAFDGVERDLVALHVEALCLAILTRLLSMRGHSNLPATGRRMAPLPKWRLKRVVDYVNAHLASRITLADLQVLPAGPECISPHSSGWRRGAAPMTSSCAGESSGRSNCCAIPALPLPTLPSASASRTRLTSPLSSSVSAEPRRTAGVGQRRFRVSGTARRPRPRPGRRHRRLKQWLHVPPHKRVLDTTLFRWISDLMPPAAWLREALPGGARELEVPPW